MTAHLDGQAVASDAFMASSSSSDLPPTAEVVAVKIMLLGDSQVGKSQIFNRLAKRRFQECPSPTEGIDFTSHTLKIDQNHFIKAQIIDTSGADKSRQIIQSYWSLVSGAVFVYDITNKESFVNLRRWIQLFQTKVAKPKSKSNSENYESPRIMVLGNKADTDSEAWREVSSAEAKTYAFTHGFLFLECSAQDDTNLTLAFTNLLTEVYHNILEKRKKSSIILSNVETSKDSGSNWSSIVKWVSGANSSVSVPGSIPNSNSHHTSDVTSNGLGKAMWKSLGHTIAYVQETFDAVTSELAGVDDDHNNASISSHESIPPAGTQIDGALRAQLALANALSLSRKSGKSGSVDDSMFPPNQHTLLPETRQILLRDHETTPVVPIIMRRSSSRRSSTITQFLRINTDPRADDSQKSAASSNQDTPKTLVDPSPQNPVLILPRTSSRFYRHTFTSSSIEQSEPLVSSAAEPAEPPPSTPYINDEPPLLSARQGSNSSRASTPRSTLNSAVSPNVKLEMDLVTLGGAQKSLRGVAHKSERDSGQEESDVDYSSPQSGVVRRSTVASMQSTGRSLSNRAARRPQWRFVLRETEEENGEN